MLFVDASQTDMVHMLVHASLLCAACCLSASHLLVRRLLFVVMGSGKLCYRLTHVAPGEELVDVISSPLRSHTTTVLGKAWSCASMHGHAPTPFGGS